MCCFYKNSKLALKVRNYIRNVCRRSVTRFNIFIELKQNTYIITLVLPIYFLSFKVLSFIILFSHFNRIYRSHGNSIEILLSFSATYTKPQISAVPGVTSRYQHLRPTPRAARLKRAHPRKQHAHAHPKPRQLPTESQPRTGRIRQMSISLRRRLQNGLREREI